MKEAPGDYHCRDRQGIVHIALERGWFDRDDQPPVDRTYCDEKNYMDRTTDLVTCIQCLGYMFRREQEEA